MYVESGVGLHVMRTNAVSTVVSSVLSPFSPQLNTNNELVLTLRNTSFLSLKSGMRGEQLKYLHYAVAKCVVLARTPTSRERLSGVFTS